MRGLLGNTMESIIDQIAKYPAVNVNSVFPHEQCQTCGGKGVITMVSVAERRVREPSGLTAWAGSPTCSYCQGIGWTIRWPDDFWTAERLGGVIQEAPYFIAYAGSGHMAIAIATHLTDLHPETTVTVRRYQLDKADTRYTSRNYNLLDQFTSVFGKK